jgi:hypothetical protein
LSYWSIANGLHFSDRMHQPSPSTEQPDLTGRYVGHCRAASISDSWLIPCGHAAVQLPRTAATAPGRCADSRSSLRPRHRAVPASGCATTSMSALRPPTLSRWPPRCRSRRAASRELGGHQDPDRGNARPLDAPAAAVRDLGIAEVPSPASTARLRRRVGLLHLRDRSLKGPPSASHILPVTCHGAFKTSRHIACTKNPHICARKPCRECLKNLDRQAAPDRGNARPPPPLPLSAIWGCISPARKTFTFVEKCVPRVPQESRSAGGAGTSHSGCA